MIKKIFLMVVVVVLVSCSSKQVAHKGNCEDVLVRMSNSGKTKENCRKSMMALCTDEIDPIQAKMAPMRYLAWMEGTYQTSYEPDRVVAAEKLQKYDGKVPEISETEEYLKYLSVLDASGRTTEAEKFIKTYLGKFPNEKRAVFLLAVHYQRTKKKELAQYLFATLEKDAKFPWRSLVLNNLGMMAFQERNRDRAMDLFERATKAQPPTAAPFVNLGSLYLQSRSYLDAEALFRRAKDIDGEFEDASLGLGSALEGQGKFAEAHQVYASYLSDNPDGLSVLYNDALVLGNRLKQKDEAAEMMLRYIQRGGKETAKAHDVMQNWR